MVVVNKQHIVSCWVTLRRRSELLTSKSIPTVYVIFPTYLCIIY